MCLVANKVNISTQASYFLTRLRHVKVCMSIGASQNAEFIRHHETS